MEPREVPYNKMTIFFDVEVTAMHLGHSYKWPLSLNPRQTCLKQFFSVSRSQLAGAGKRTQDLSKGFFHPVLLQSPKTLRHSTPVDFFPEVQMFLEVHQAPIL